MFTHTLPFTSPASRRLVVGLALTVLLLSPACSAQADSGHVGAPAGTVLTTGERTPAPAGTVLPTVPGTRPPEPLPTNEVLRRQSCPGLDPVLFDLTQAPDPAAFATSHDVIYEGGRVGITVILGADPGDLAQRYNLEGTSRITQYLSARAPVSTLCALANDERVLRVTRAQRAKNA